MLDGVQILHRKRHFWEVDMCRPIAKYRNSADVGVRRRCDLRQITLDACCEYQCRKLLNACIYAASGVSLLP